MADGSRVEMRAESRISLKPAADGIQITLITGSVIVNAAKQGNGHLYVQTRDCTVSVIGTVFLVTADEEGSRVAVIQGEVHVQHGTTLKALLPWGEQMATVPTMKALPVAEEISWSRYAAAHLELLKQSAPVPIAALNESSVHAAPEVGAEKAAEAPARTTPLLPPTIPPSEAPVEEAAVPKASPAPDAYRTTTDRALAEKARGDLKAAIADFDKAVKLKPDSAEAYNNRALAEYAQGDLRGAIADFSKITELKPGDAEAYNHRAAAEYAKGNFDSSRSDEVKAADLQKGSSPDPAISSAQCSTSQPAFAHGEPYRAYAGCAVPRSQAAILNLRGTRAMAVDGKPSYNVPSQAKQKSEYYQNNSDSLEILPGRHTIRFLVLEIGKLIRSSGSFGPYVEEELDVKAGKTYTAFATMLVTGGVTRTTIEITDPDKTPAAYLQLHDAAVKDSNPSAALSALESYLILFPKDPGYKAAEDMANQLRVSLITNPPDAPQTQSAVSKAGCTPEQSEQPEPQERTAMTPDRPASPDLALVLSRSSRYVEQYESQLGNLIGEEIYAQDQVASRIPPFVSPFAPNGNRNGGPDLYNQSKYLQTEADFAILHVGPDWIGVREVKCLDGVAVQNKGGNFQKILSDLPHVAQKTIDNISRESALYNVGDVYRTTSLPTFALRILRKGNTRRFEFKRSGETLVGGIRTWAVGFHVVLGPSIVRDLAYLVEFASGSFWLVAESGRVLKTEVIVAGRQRQVSFRSQTVVSYKNDPKLGMLVPVSMEEHYDTAGRRTLDCRADYFNFRRPATSNTPAAPVRPMAPPNQYR